MVKIEDTFTLELAVFPVLNPANVSSETGCGTGRRQLTGTITALTYVPVLPLGFNLQHWTRKSRDPNDVTYWLALLSVGEPGG